MGTSRKTSGSDKPFMDDFLDWVGSPEGQAYIELSDLLWSLMRDVKLDAAHRRFLLPGGRRLGFSGIAKHLHKQQSNCELGDVKQFLADWIDNYAPEGMTHQELDELDSLLEGWVDEIRMNI